MATKQAELKEKILSELPALTGSEKQIAWAEKIRQAWMGDMKAMFQMVSNRNYPSTKMPPIYELQKLAEKHDQVEASWWIDNRRGAATGQRGY